MIKNSGLPITPISLKLQKNIIEKFIVEEDKTLQKKWSNMLANAATKKFHVTVNYTQILSGLEPDEVIILDYLFKYLQKDFDKGVITEFMIKDMISKGKDFDSEKIKLPLDILFSKRLIESPKIDVGNSVSSPYPLQSSTYDVLSLTRLGFAFMQACNFGNNIENKL